MSFAKKDTASVFVTPCVHPESSLSEHWFSDFAGFTCLCYFFVNDVGIKIEKTRIKFLLKLVIVLTSNYV